MKKKNPTDYQNKRFLITINVLGSSGPLRFVVNDDDKVSKVIHSSLKMYARSGRLPVLGSDFNNFFLYPSSAAGSQAMEANEAVGLCGERNFVLCKKQNRPQMSEARLEMMSSHRDRGSRSWKTWFKILSH